LNAAIAAEGFVFSSRTTRANITWASAALFREDDCPDAAPVTASAAAQKMMAMPILDSMRLVPARHLSSNRLVPVA
jgi:hypothetical protein